LGFRAAHRVSGEFDPVSVVDEAVEDGVGVGGVTDQAVPVGDGDLAGNQGGLASVPILEDLEEIMTSLRAERLKAPVIEDQELDRSEALEATGEAAVAVGKSELIEQLGRSDVENGSVVAAGFVAKRAGEPAFSDAGRGSDMLPGIRRLKGGSSTRSTLATVSSFR